MLIQNMETLSQSDELVLFVQNYKRTELMDSAL